MGKAAIDRRSGVAIWRQIADELRSDISNGKLLPDDRLEPETALAARFNVNRHTVRAAIQALASEGIVESRQGQGTFVLRRARVVYPIGSRTRFSQGLSDQAKTTNSSLLSHARQTADAEVARALDLKAGAKVIRLETLSEADGQPISRSTSWFCAEKFPMIAAAYEKERSMTRALASLGVADYLRNFTRIEAKHANADDAQDLRLSPGGIVLVTEYTNCDGKGRPVQYAVSRFAADRVSLEVGKEALRQEED